MAKTKHSPQAKLVGTAALFTLSGFALLALKNLDVQTTLMALVVPIAFIIVCTLIPKLFPADRLLLTLVNFLCVLGIMVLYRISPEKGMTQAVNYGFGVIFMIVCMLIIRHMHRLKALVWLAAATAVVLMLLPLAIGKEVNGAQAWISIVGVNFQPSEIVKVVLLIVVAYFLSKRRILIAISYAGVCLALLMLQKDLGTALLYYAVTLSMLFASTGSFALLGGGLAGGAAAGMLGYSMFSHVKRRVAIWRDPWFDYNGAGYQVVQSLIAIVNGGLTGVGLGVGNTHVIPAHDTDFIFSVILNEFGAIFGICVVFIYVMIFLRGIAISLRCNHRFHALMALGSSLFIAFQAFVIIGGNIKMIPLTGVTLPFVSYGGSSLLSSLGIIGILQGIESINEDHIAADAMMATIGDEV
ncbi:MAG: FtsW/RodA/SpoVE family cell cycle protein [Eubacteriales bacterium]|nr:FtsW/RodA/SpoVE family cell cycle protein [Eubacteriales bacterium]MDD4711527.1 FtsW/RodA/SpoVE family cell cycle protein [Eubacteriales bacterium]